MLPQWPIKRHYISIYNKNGKSATIKMADRTTDDYVIKSQVNAPLKTCFKTFKILLKRAVRMRNMPFQRDKFQKCSGGSCIFHNTVGPPMASALPQKKSSLDPPVSLFLHCFQIPFTYLVVATKLRVLALDNSFRTGC